MGAALQTVKREQGETVGDPLVVAVDGPGGSGKSTVARALARRLGVRYLDTGAMYRAVTWLVLQRRLDIEDAEGLAQVAERAALTVATDPDAPGIAVDGTDVSSEIRSRPVTSAVSAVSAVEAVRRRLVDQQRAIIAAERTGIVVEGRDIGTVVAPHAPLKVFLTASTAVRARRRSAEIGEAGDDAVAQTMAELGRRDAIDSGRVASPLAQAPDALVVDSSDLSVDAVVDLIVAELSARVGLADVRTAT
jgi:cytidylate kinase